MKSKLKQIFCRHSFFVMSRYSEGRNVVNIIVCKKCGRTKKTENLPKRIWGTV